MSQFKYIYLLIPTLFFACKQDNKQSHILEEAKPQTEQFYVISASGNPLPKLPFADTVFTELEMYIDTARNYYLQHLEVESGYALYAKRLMEAGHFENALSVLSKGATKFPNSQEMLRYKGEAEFLSRQFSLASATLWKAGKAGENQKAKPENTNINPQAIKTLETVQYNVWKNYAMSLQGQNNMVNAAQMYEILTDFSTNSDLYTMSYYWMYPAYLRAGKTNEAKEILNAISAKAQITSIAKPYLDAMLFYKGEIAETSFLDFNKVPSDVAAIDEYLIKAYALGMDALNKNQANKAIAVFEKMMSTQLWNRHSYVLAEAALAQIKGTTMGNPEEINLDQKNKVKE